MPVQVTCSCCGAKSVEPDPDINRFTARERIKFEKAWDARVAKHQSKEDQ